MTDKKTEHNLSVSICYPDDESQRGTRVADVVYRDETVIEFLDRMLQNQLRYYPSLVPHNVVELRVIQHYEATKDGAGYTLGIKTDKKEDCPCYEMYSAPFKFPVDVGDRFTCFKCGMIREWKGPNGPWDFSRVVPSKPEQPTISELAEPVLKKMESEGFTFTKQKVDKAEDLQMEVERNQPCQECERLREGIKVLRALFPEKDMIADREFEALLNPHNVLGPEEKE